MLATKYHSHGATLPGRPRQAPQIVHAQNRMESYSLIHSPSALTPSSLNPSSLASNTPGRTQTPQTLKYGPVIQKAQTPPPVRSPVLFTPSSPRSNSLPIPPTVRSVHRAKSSPNLVVSDGKKKSNLASTNAPPMPVGFEFTEKRIASPPIPRNFFGNRVSNASSLATTTTTTASTISTYSDRSSGSSNTLYPIVQKAPSGRPIPPIEVDTFYKDSSSMKSNTYAHSISDSLNSQYISAIDIINDYTDDFDVSSAVSYSTTNNKDSLVATHLPAQADSSPASSPIQEIPELDELESSHSKPTPSPQSTSSSPPVIHLPPSINKNPDSNRDRYGFKKGTSHITEAQYDKWLAAYTPYIQRRKKKWIRFMKDSGLQVLNDNPTKFPPNSDKRMYPVS